MRIELYPPELINNYMLQSNIVVIFIHTLIVTGGGAGNCVVFFKKGEKNYSSFESIL